MPLRKLINILSLFTAIILFSVYGHAASKEQQFITIGTGGVTGVYYPAGGAICRLVNKARKLHGIRCSVESTNGSVFNIGAMKDGELDMGVVQSDSHYFAYHGLSKFQQDGAMKDLRSVFALHAEPFTVVARTDAKVSEFSDIKSKRVSIGNAGSGQRNTMEVLMAALGWTLKDFSEVHELKSSEQSKAICDNKIDVMVYTVGHPTGAIKEATSLCNSKIIPVKGQAVDKLVNENPYYRKVNIPGGMYRGNDADIPTFGVGATFMTTAKMPEETVYEVVKAVFENFDTFRRLHPAFEHLSKKSMISDGLSAPLHPGAIKYYKEAGLM